LPYWFDHPVSPEKVESHLPEQGVSGVSDHPREPGPKDIVVEMGHSKILLNDIPDFRDGFVPIYFMLRQFRSSDGLGHDAVGDFVQVEEVSVVVPKIPFIGIHFLNGLIGMTAAGDAKKKKWAVMKGGRGEGEVGFHYLEVHRSSEWMNLKEISQ
jgi:hypothetical protein